MVFLNLTLRSAKKISSNLSRRPSTEIVFCLLAPFAPSARKRPACFTLPGSLPRHVIGSDILLRQWLHSQACLALHERQILRATPLVLIMARGRPLQLVSIRSAQAITLVTGTVGNPGGVGGSAAVCADSGDVAASDAANAAPAIRRGPFMPLPRPRAGLCCRPNARRSARHANPDCASPVGHRRGPRDVFRGRIGRDRSPARRACAENRSQP